MNRLRRITDENRMRFTQYTCRVMSTFNTNASLIILFPLMNSHDYDTQEVNEIMSEGSEEPIKDNKEE